MSDDICLKERNWSIEESMNDINYSRYLISSCEMKMKIICLKIMKISWNWNFENMIINAEYIIHEANAIIQKVKWRENGEMKGTIGRLDREAIVLSLKGTPGRILTGGNENFITISGDWLQPVAPGGVAWPGYKGDVPVSRNIIWEAKWRVRRVSVESKCLQKACVLMAIQLLEKRMSCAVLLPTSLSVMLGNFHEVWGGETF